MKYIIITVSFIFLTCSGCKGQNREYKSDINKNLPQTNINVTREYDKNGNLIRYDSLYSSYFSNIKGDTIMKDSIFNDFKNIFNQSYFFSNQPFFKNFFFEDSLLIYDFYKKDFFFNRFKQNMQKMDSLFREMDMMKNDYFNSQFNKAPKKN